jgi:uncharacterized protein HemX
LVDKRGGVGSLGVTSLLGRGVGILDVIVALGIGVGLWLVVYNTNEQQNNHNNKHYQS